MKAHGITFFAATVKPIPNDGGAKPLWVCGVLTELVGSSCQRLEFDARYPTFQAQPLPSSYAHFALYRIVYLIGAIVGIQTKCQSDLAFSLLYNAFHQCDILLLNLP